MNGISSSQRTVIALAGLCNSGKSSLLNCLSGQDTSLVSDTAGTTTDPVRKAMELPGLGAVTFIDTPGLDDSGELGERRVARAESELEKADIIIAVLDSERPDIAKSLVERLRGYKTPILAVMTKSDICDDAAGASAALSAAAGIAVTPVDSISGNGREDVITRLSGMQGGEPESILGNLVNPGDTVVLVMPQDPQAPKGRLILPQSLTLRELLGRGCRAVCCVPAQLKETIGMLRETPDLIITDSQVFGEVYKSVPDGCRLTSFSVLMAGYKGDIALFTEGSKALDSLTENSRVLIAEACTHAPQNEDIGRVKLPRLLRKRIGEGLHIDIVGGNDFPADLTGYDLVIHCGGCMFTRRHVMSRVAKAVEAGVPVTNYGIVLAGLTGILDKVTLP